MADEKFDAIVVGGGLAGLAAAYTMANSGLAVLLVERGDWCGAKNMTGGRLYAHTLENLIPGFADEAPVEREIVKDRLSSKSDNGIITVEYDSGEIQAAPNKSYSVLRSGFDKWFAEKAEDAGVLMVTSIVVDDLIVRDGVVCGIVAGEDEMEASVVVLADGVNSLLGQKLGVKKELRQDQAVVGAKEVIKLPAEEINARFNLKDGEGLAWMLLGCCEDSGVCDGFLYTNRDTVSLGINLRVSDVDKCTDSVAQMMEDFKNSDLIAPLVAGGELVEYSAHLIPEGGAEMMPTPLSGEGWMIIGDAAAMCANFGFSLHGMDLAIESGRLAAETVIAAEGECSAEKLADYDKKVKESLIMEYMNLQDNCRKAVESERWKDGAPDVFNAALNGGM